jgi:hypothetical protein
VTGMGAGHRLALGLILGLASLLAGCGGKYSSSCKKAVELTSPWSSFGFPVSDGRVCESGTKDAKIQYISKDADKWRAAYEDKMLGAGYEKKDCKSGYCVYAKGTSRVQIIVSSMDRWVNVALHENH